MKKSLFYLAWIILAISLITQNGFAVVGQYPAMLDKAGVEKALGRELTFEEKLVLPLLKAKIKKGMDAELAADEAKTDGLGIAGMILGIASLFVAGLILGLLAVIFSMIALGRIKKNPDTRKGKGFAIAGLVLGGIGMIGWAIAIILLL